MSVSVATVGPPVTTINSQLTFQGQHQTSHAPDRPEKSHTNQGNQRGFFDFGKNGKNSEFFLNCNFTLNLLKIELKCNVGFLVTFDEFTTISRQILYFGLFII